MDRPVIALLTDFGLRDHYVGAMKGVMLGIVPEATLVDITHEIPPQDVTAAALELVACYRDFPPGTVFLVVVDPGVGTLRHALAASCHGYFFVAPDNGVLAPVLDRSLPVVVQITDRRFGRPRISRTFEGRDRFGPAAAWLARGTEIRELGMELPVYQPLDLPVPHRFGDVIEGEILRVDRFGNLISNLDERTIPPLEPQAEPVVRIGGREVPRVMMYGQVSYGELCALIGSGGYLEVALNGGSAAQVLGLGRGARIVVAPDRAALSQYDGEQR